MQRAGAGIRSLAEPYLDTTSDFAEIVFAILGVATKLERRRILERTARGRADAKANGVKFGRKPTLTPHQQKEARERLDAARRSAASPAATMSAKARFHGYLHETASAIHYHERFVEAHLVSLLSTGQMKFSRPDSFNDPWDCRVHYQVPTEPAEKKRILAYLIEMHRKHHPGIDEAERQRRANEFMANPAKFKGAFVQMEKGMYAELCRQYKSTV